MNRKTSLPGPRLLFVCARQQVVGNFQDAALLCQLVNSSIKITNVSHEARGAVESAYHRVPIMVKGLLPPRTIPSLCIYASISSTSKTLTLIPDIDYNLDTLVIDWLFNDFFGPQGREELAPLLSSTLSNAKHLAFTEYVFDEPWQGIWDDPLAPERLWDMIRTNCTRLESLRFADGLTDGRDGVETGIYFPGEWRLLDLPGDISQALGEELPDESNDVGEEYGPIAQYTARSQTWRPKFKAYIEKNKEWKDVQYESSIFAERKGPEAQEGEYRGWGLSYWVGQMEQRDPAAHLHREPVVLGETVVECSVLPTNKVLDDNELCPHCHTLRLREKNDAFWLPKMEDESSDAESQSAEAEVNEYDD